MMLLTREHGNKYLDSGYGYSCSVLEEIQVPHPEMKDLFFFSLEIILCVCENQCFPKENRKIIHIPENVRMKYK